MTYQIPDRGDTYQTHYGEMRVQSVEKLPWGPYNICTEYVAVDGRTCGVDGLTLEEFWEQAGHGVKVNPPVAADPTR